ncbi:MAG TPA: MFS transporter [Oscillibacter sp.]|nr:MFS transporter [Oscillibacter sp.]
MLVGLAFLSICIFWQMYDSVMTLILTDTFHLNETIAGAVMAADNVLALFLLPLFGALSDKTNTRIGRRMPYIIGGTAAAIILMNLLPVLDNAYAASPSPLTLGLFIAVLALLLVAMGVYRSPAVALMPDVTVKPLRSKANAIINLMGSAGGILVLVLGMVFATASVRNALMSYTAYFAVIAAIMLTALVIFLLTVREPEWAAQMVEDSVRYGLEDKPAEAEQLAENADVAEPAAAAEPAQPQKQGLSPEEKKSMIFILLSIVLWFFGYNAVTSKYSVYASNILHKDYNLTLIIAQAAAIISYLPVGMIASKVGRKKTIRAGVIMLAAAFGVAAFLRDNSPSMLMNAMFALAGIAWATINVNSFPMVVEMCSEQDVGRYTGLYYTASMAAQVATPMLSGLLMDKLGMTVLFPYAAVFSALALVSLHFVHHGDSRPEAKKGLDALEDMDN